MKEELKAKICNAFSREEYVANAIVGFIDRKISAGKALSYEWDLAVSFDDVADIMECSRNTVVRLASDRVIRTVKLIPGSKRSSGISLRSVVEHLSKHHHFEYMFDMTINGKKVSFPSCVPGIISSAQEKVEKFIKNLPSYSYRISDYFKRENAAKEFESLLDCLNDIRSFFNVVNCDYDLQTKIKCCDLSYLTQSILINNGIDTVYQLISLRRRSKPASLWKGRSLVKGVGYRTIKEIESFLNKHGLCFGLVNVRWFFDCEECGGYLPNVFHLDSGIKLGALGFSHKAMSVFNVLGMTTVGDLVSSSEYELCQARSVCGKKTLNEICDTMIEHGLSFASGEEVVK